MPTCPRCGDRMSLIDETTKLIEYRCSECHAKVIDRKEDKDAEQGDGN